MDAYTIYCQWCKDHHRPAPTRAWWDRATAQAQAMDHRSADQREIDRERREGWGYGL